MTSGAGQFVRREIDRRGTLWLAAAIAAFGSFEYIALGPDSWIYGYAGGLESIPVYLGLAETGSTWSLWSPIVAGGFDRLSFMGNADPLNVEVFLFSILPVWLASGLHVFLQRFLGVYFTARVCEEQLGLSRGACAVAGILHACFAYPSVGEMMSMASVPLLIWTLGRLGKAAYGAGWALPAGVAFSTLTTFAHSFPYMLLFAAAWFFLVAGERSLRFYGRAAIFFVVIFVFDAPQFVAIAFNAPFSHRAGFPAEEIGGSPANLFYYQFHYDYFDQDKVLRPIMVWLPPIVLVAAAALAAVRGRNSTEGRLFLRVAALYGLLSLRIAFILAQKLAATVLPWVTGINMIRFHTVPASFMTAVGVGMGLWVILPATLPFLRGCRIVGTATALLIAFLLVRPKVALFYPLMIDDWGEKNYHVRALDDLRASDRGLFRVASVLDLQPAYAYAQGFETADGWSNLYPAVYRDLWLRILQPLFVMLPHNRQIFDPDKGRPQDHYIFLGTGLLVPGIGLNPDEDPDRARVEGFDIERRFNLNLLSLLNVKYLLSEALLKAGGLKLVHAPPIAPAYLPSRDYATGRVNSPRPGHQRLEGWPGARQVWSDLRDSIERRSRGKDLYIYENLNVIPRFRFATRVERAPSGKDVLDRLSAMTADELRDTAVVQTADAGALKERQSHFEGSVEVAEYRPDRIVLNVDGKGPMFIVIANTWNPFWQAETDGVPVPLARTNHAQFGLEVPPGFHRVTLQYVPPYHPLRPLGTVLACAIIGVLGAALGFLSWRAAAGLRRGAVGRGA